MLKKVCINLTAFFVFPFFLEDSEKFLEDKRNTSLKSEFKSQGEMTSAASCFSPTKLSALANNVF